MRPSETTPRRAWGPVRLAQGGMRRCLHDGVGQSNWDGCLGERQGEGEGRALARHATALDPDAAAHRVDVGAADGEAKTGAGDVGSDVALEADETLEEQWDLVGRNAV